MKRSLAQCLAASLALLALSRGMVAQEEPARQLNLRNNPKLSAVIEEYRGIITERMADRHVPGLAIALVDRDGIVWAQGFGHVDGAQSRPVDTKTTFSLQSSSKSFTALAALLAVQDGLVDLDEPVATYLPEFTVHTRFEPHPERRMTFRHLLSHHAGFTHEAPIGNNYTWDYGSFDAHVRSISDTWLRFPVGQRYSYANLGVDLAGYILGRLSGSSFPEYMRRRVLQPLGMTGSSFDWDVIAAMENRAVAHWPQFDSIPLRYALIPSGGLYSNVEDLAKFIRFHLNGGRVNGQALISDELLKQQYALQFPVDGQTEGYCLGLRRSLRYGTPHFHHTGGGYGFQSNVAWYPTHGFGIVVLTNAFGHDLTNRLPNELVSRLFEAVLGTVPGSESKPPEFKAIDVTESFKRRLVGNYVGRDGNLGIELRGDTLGVDFGRQYGFAPVQLISEREAYMAVGQGWWRLRFALHDDGSPGSVTRTNDGEVYDYDSGPNDPPGPDDPKWARYQGTYVIEVWGTTVEEDKVEVRNGYLTFDGQLLEEYQPGLFFSSTGEALDFRGEQPTWRNIEIVRSDE